MKCPICGAEFDKFLVTNQEENLYRCPECWTALTFRITPLENYEFAVNYDNVAQPDEEDSSD